MSTKTTIDIDQSPALAQFLCIQVADIFDKEKQLGDGTGEPYIRALSNMIIAKMNGQGIWNTGDVLHIQLVNGGNIHKYPNGNWINVQAAIAKEFLDGNLVVSSNPSLMRSRLGRRG